MKQYTNRFLASVLALAMLLSMAACSGGGNTAATMHLRRAQGTVSISDGGGKNVPVLENLGLYSGYEVGTSPASYAWIDLDEVKLTKLDQNSEIAIQQDGKKLDIELKSGSLFFNVTQPLEDDETMNIHASTMLVGIRGTSGWVSCEDRLSRVYLLEGKVECSAGEQTVQVNAGEYAELTPDGQLVVQEFDQGDIPAFVQTEVDIDPPGGPAETPTPTPEPASTPTPEPTGTPEPTQPDGEQAEYDEDSGVTGDLTWSLSGGTLTIEGTGDMPDYSAYGSLNGAPWYNYRKQIHTLIIGSGVTSIGGNAFSFFHGLTNVVLPNSVTYIGYNAFQECISLKAITIPDSVTGMGTKAFFNSYNLESVTIPGSVTSIGSQAFNSCGSLTDVYYGGSEDQWSQIEIGTFNAPLTGANIHYNSAGEAPGPDASASPEPTLEPTPTPTPAPQGITWSLDNGTLTISGTGPMGNYQASSPHPPWYQNRNDITAVVIEDGVTSIGDFAFYTCSLTSIDIPDSVTSIGEKAFFLCNDLTDVNIGSGVTSIGTMAFGSCRSLTSITIPDSVTSIGNQLFSACSSLTSVTIPDSVTSIGDSTFSMCTNLTSVTIPDGVTSIGAYAFYSCSSLTDVYYTGSEGQWEQIDIGDSNAPLRNAAIHYNS